MPGTESERRRDSNQAPSSLASLAPRTYARSRSRSISPRDVVRKQIREIIMWPKPAEPKASQPAAQQARPNVKWDTTNLRSSYSNFCDANSTRGSGAQFRCEQDLGGRGAGRARYRAQSPHRALARWREAPDRTPAELDERIRIALRGAAGEVGDGCCRRRQHL